MPEPSPSLLALGSVAAGALGLAAIAAFAYGVMGGSLVALALPVAAVVLGVVALRRPGAPGDRRLARAGLALGLLALTVIVIGVWALWTVRATR